MFRQLRLNSNFHTVLKRLTWPKWTKFLDEACMAMFWLTPCFQESIFHRSGSSTEETLICAPAVTGGGGRKREEGGDDKNEKGLAVETNCSGVGEGVMNSARYVTLKLKDHVGVANGVDRTSNLTRFVTRVTSDKSCRCDKSRRNRYLVFYWHRIPRSITLHEFRLLGMSII